jgi:hypothetical protein
MLLARFMYERAIGDINNYFRDAANRGSIITGHNGITNFYDHAAPAALGINFLLADNPDRTAPPFPAYDNPCIDRYLDKLHIRHDPQLHNGGAGGASPNTIAINEFYIACRQTGALLSGFLTITNAQLTYP